MKAFHIGAMVALATLASGSALAQNYMDSPGWKQGHAAQDARHRAAIAEDGKRKLAADADAQRQKELALENKRNAQAREAQQREHAGYIEAQNRAKRKNGGKLPTGALSTSFPPR